MTRQFFALLFFVLSFTSYAEAESRLHLFEDFLYWKASEQTASTWASVVTITDQLAVRDFTASNVDFHWSPGIRVGFDYDMPRFGDIKGYWTYLSTKANEAIYAQPGHIILPEFFNGFTSGNVFFEASLSWRLKMHVFDVELGHAMHPSDALMLRPFIGVKGAAIDQKIASDWNALVYRSTEEVTNNFYGVGPSFGIDGVWNIYRNLSLVSNASTAFLWGHWQVTDKYVRPEALIGLVPATVISSDTDNSMLGTFMFRYFAGVEWSHKSTTEVTVKAGYEMQLWPNQLRLREFQQLPTRGNLTLQGLTCGIFILL